MGAFSLISKGDFSPTRAALQTMKLLRLESALHRAGKMGVQALESVTPRDSGITAGSWAYEIDRRGGTSTVFWTNGEMINGTPLVIMLQYGHGTGNGGYVQGRDFINPAIQPVFDSITKDVWTAVIKA